MIDFKLTKVHRYLDTDETVRFVFMLFVAMGIIMPVTFVDVVGPVVTLLAMLPSLYITFTRLIYINRGMQ